MNSHALGNLHSLQLGQVTDNADPDSRGRIKVRLLATQMELWASVVAPSAGQGYGASFVPRLEEIVVLAFITPEMPLVLGSVWAGSSSVPAEADPQEDHYVIRTPQETVLDFDDGNGPKLELRTRSGYKISIDEAGGGEIVIERSDQSVTLNSTGIAVRSSGSVTVDASTVTINASMVTVNASMSKFSGVVQADTVIATAVVGSSYTPGAGNIW
ncbi:phage baseplate assembly protein V [Methylomonas albis]|uniref:VgrG protein n=1 Tax=Methylomonas albis TaxID=1854563 RepID=A0ABR9D4X7_9GAMM|nr:phage baseplate assembly protein V [Methylomonas albis]MBD9358169.1 VgrG protein [Methylomonas albis]